MSQDQDADTTNDAMSFQNVMDNIDYTSAKSLTNGMSIDVEEYFQVWAFARASSKRDWDNFPSRIEECIATALRLFDDAGVKATFFTLGWIAERHPTMIREIADAGHEIASHGYAHDKVTSLTMQEFRDDVIKARQILEQVSGQSVIGYRAPSFSIGLDNLEALEVLGETGHVYSSSIYPIRHDHYGTPDSARFANRPTQKGVLEIPMSTIRIFERNFPCSGGGYFRLVPYQYFRWAIRRINKMEDERAIFYFHPWELDPSQPRMRNISMKSRFRHYVNLDRMEGRMSRLLAEFQWDRIDNLFLDR